MGVFLGLPCNHEDFNICLSLSIYSDNRDSWDIIGIAMVYPANAYRFWSAENGDNCDQLLEFGSILGYFLKKTSLSIQSDNLGYHLGFTG